MAIPLGRAAAKEMGRPVGTVDGGALPEDSFLRIAEKPLIRA